MLSGLKALTYSVNSNGTELAPLHTRRLEAVSLFSWSIDQKERDTQITTRVTEGARRERPSFSRLTASPFDARGGCTLLAKSKEKERLLAVYHTHSGWLNIYFRVCGSYVITLHLSVAQKLYGMCRSAFAPL